MKLSLPKIGVGVLLIFLLAWYSLFLFQKIDLTRIDLGRHLKNGEIFFNSQLRKPLLKTNFYSYTHTDFPFINHHWGSGAIFFVVEKIGGFAGLHLFYIILSLITFLIFFGLAQREGGFAFAFLLSLLLLPLIAERREVRPEAFSYFFAALFFWLLWQYRQGRLKQKHLYVLPIIELIWVNTHILFFLGPLMVGFLLLEKLLVLGQRKEKKDLIKKLAVIFALTSLATLFNPFGLSAVFYPLRIFKNYGYRIIENQSVWFLEKLGFLYNPNFVLFKIALSLVVLSFVLLIVKNRQGLSLFLLCLAIFLGVAACWAIKNFTIFALFALPIISYQTKKAFGQTIKPKTTEETLGFAFLALLIFVIALAAFSLRLSLQTNKFGLGLVPQNNIAAEFFKQNNIAGPIFNNFDIGSYLVYHLYPKERVFVDNRPEAYPASFFQDVYIPMQQSEDVWQQQSAFYNFNAIFFSHQDVTPWGQNFLVKRIGDAEWAPVFIDQYAIIFVKRNVLNKKLIEKHEIPRKTFGQSQPQSPAE